jgi:folate-binding protein YgfZ
MPDLALTILEDIAVVGARGADSVNFLQGQLSRDLAQLPDGGAVLAGLHSPQGRCLAVLRVLRVTHDHLLLVLPADLSDMVRQLLTRHVLRAKVRLEDAGAAWRVYGATGPDAAAAGSTRLSVALDGAGLRQLILAPRGEPLPDGDIVSRDSWRLDDIAAGLPEIVAATSGQFVAQMLNLDLLDAISFSKGCYTGQEIIARAHYRGQVKRRMQRFHTGSDLPLLPGDRVRLTDGRAAQVVMAAPAEGGGQQFLGVTTLPGSVVQVVEPGADLETGPAMALPAVALPLPYLLPG